MNDSVKKMWDDFCEKESIDPSTPYESWHFCDTKELADNLADLVLSGQKRGTTALSFLTEYDGDAPAKVGSYDIITDFSGNAKCVIFTEEVVTIPFCEVGDDLAAIEGEGDGTLKYWREAHISIFSRWMEEIGHKFTEDMNVDFQIFKVVYK